MPLSASSVGSLRDLGELLKPATPRNSDSGIFSSNPSSTTPSVTRVDPNYINDGSSDEELAVFYNSNKKEGKSKLIKSFSKNVINRFTKWLDS